MMKQQDKETLLALVDVAIKTLGVAAFNDENKQKIDSAIAALNAIPVTENNETQEQELLTE